MMAKVKRNGGPSWHRLLARMSDGERRAVYAALDHLLVDISRLEQGVVQKATTMRREQWPESFRRFWHYKGNAAGCRKIYNHINRLMKGVHVGAITKTTDAGK